MKHNFRFIAICLILLTLGETANSWRFPALDFILDFAWLKNRFENRKTF